jgi:hypothetical protein
MHKLYVCLALLNLMYELFVCMLLDTNCVFFQKLNADYVFFQKLNVDCVLYPAVVCEMTSACLLLLESTVTT